MQRFTRGSCEGLPLDEGELWENLTVDEEDHVKAYLLTKEDYG